MTQRICCRCQTVLLVEDAGTLVFCWTCGAPQVVLSEELREQTEQQEANTPPAIPGGPTQAAAVPDPTTVGWKTVIRLAAGVALFFSFLSLLMPPLVVLVPAIVLGLYASRFRQTRVTTALGAKLGLLCGVFTALGVICLLTIALLTARFGTGQMERIDAPMTARLTAIRDQAVASHDPMQISLANDLFIPEFRATLGLLGMLTYVVLIVGSSTASGAFAGYVRSRVRAR